MSQLNKRFIDIISHLINEIKDLNDLRLRLESDIQENDEEMAERERISMFNRLKKLSEFLIQETQTLE